LPLPVRQRTPAWPAPHTRVMKRIALVTGASRGLGAVIARVLAGRDFDLVLTARTQADLERTAADLGSSNIVLTRHGDLTDPFTRQTLIDAARDLGGLDILINNASELGGITPLAETALSRLERVLAVNTLAPLALTQAALPLLSSRHGLVVNVSSDAATGGYPGWGAYGATKAALDLLSRTLATELTPTGVGVVSVDPGDLRTRMHQEAFPGEDISDRPLPDVTARFWSWLVDQDPMAVTGARFKAQTEREQWTVPV
jgi:NAD(P)-dependent dehydrogenase (short-subunit alcohol dehydrogenase family)